MPTGREDRMELKVGAPKVNREIVFTLDPGANTKEAAKLYGEKVVHGRWVRGFTINASQTARAMLEAGKSDEEITAYMQNEWKPGVSRRVGADPLKPVLRKAAEMTPEEKKALLERVMEALQAE
jgi:hypothetical protein